MRALTWPAPAPRASEGQHRPGPLSTRGEPRCGLRRVRHAYPPAVIVPLEQPPPAVFAAGLAQVTALLAAPERAGVRRDLALRSVPAPRSMAPWALAVAAEVHGPVPGPATGPRLRSAGTDEAVGGGRFVVLHDPAGQAGWHGETRVVTFVEADVDAEIAADPALAEVAWSWLHESLQERSARSAAAGGTVTRTLSTRLGELADGDDTGAVEVRASWTAVPENGRLDLGAHLLAWCDLLAATAGLPPPGVAALPRR